MSKNAAASSLHIFAHTTHPAISSQPFKMLSKAMLTSGLPSAIHSAALGAGCWRLLAAATGSRHLATDDSNKSPGVVGKVKEGMGGWLGAVRGRSCIAC